MRIPPPQSCIVGAILFFVGCSTEIGVPSGLGAGGSEASGGSGTGSSAKNTEATKNKGGSNSSGQKTGTGGKVGATTGAGGSSEEGGSDGQGGSGEDATGGRDGVGGSSASTKGGGGTAKGGSSTATGGKTAGIGGKTAGTGGKIAGTGGKIAGTGGFVFGTGGTKATGGGATGGAATGGGTSTSTSTSTSTTPSAVDCNATMPTGGTLHSGNGQGGKDNLAWQIWSNVGSGSLTTFSVPAFSASWNNSGDYLGRLGYEWGNAGKAYTAYGTIGIDYVFKKTGTGGPYSYVGVYGWSTNPCIEWYIVEDSFSAMPFNTGDPVSGTADIDGGTYNLVTRHTTGTGGNRCGNVSSWDQFYSIRKKGSQCGHISVSEHFKAWDAKGWKLGNLLEVKILVEAGGGSGSVEFPIANVTISQ